MLPMNCGPWQWSDSNATPENYVPFGGDKPLLPAGCSRALELYSVPSQCTVAFLADFPGAHPMCDDDRCVIPSDDVLAVIGAAPVMLDALKVALFQLQYVLRFHDGRERENIRRTMTKVEDAIAAAETYSPTPTPEKSRGHRQDAP